jgi:transposase
MRKKRMTKEKVAEVIKLLAEGKDIRQIAADYNVSVATIYNYKTRLAREGATLPKAKRGRKPKHQQGAEQATRPKPVFQTLPVAVKMEAYHFIINGVKVSVSGNARTVHIAPDQMIINF